MYISLIIWWFGRHIWRPNNAIKFFRLFQKWNATYDVIYWIKLIFRTISTNQLGFLVKGHVAFSHSFRKTRLSLSCFLFKYYMISFRNTSFVSFKASHFFFKKFDRYYVLADRKRLACPKRCICEVFKIRNSALWRKRRM
jgi:hypothetical protein